MSVSISSSPIGTTMAELPHPLLACRWVDLTHPFDADIPHYAGFPAMAMRDVFTLERDGVWSQEYRLVGQWGTHIDPPAHLAAGKRTLDQIEIGELVLPLVVIDVHQRAAQDPDTCMTIEDVRAWEGMHGGLPRRAFVAMRTDWSQRWPDQAATYNLDSNGVAHWPGWTLEVLRYLFTEKQVVAIGHETIGTDGGIKTSLGNFEGQRYLSTLDRYQIELMAHLDQLPPRGAMVVVAFPRLRGGSGFPARIFALIPS